MRLSSADLPPSRLPEELPWRDVLLVIVVTLSSVVLSAYFELNEAFYALTRHAEYLQVDEWPMGVLVLLIGLIWLSWKRNRQARRQLESRRVAEATLAGLLIENRKLAGEHLRILEVERKQLARELHDELGQYLNAIKLDAVSIEESGGANAALSTDAARAIVRTADHIHGALSDMIARLRPAGLDELGLLAAIEHCVDHWRQRLPSTRFRLLVSGNWEELGEPLNLTIYRLIQEGLTNVYKHAHAQQVTISLERGGERACAADKLLLSVVDDGRGMQLTAPSSRFGIRGMRERVEMAGGTFSLESAPGRGLRFEACLPSGGGL